MHCLLLAVLLVTLQQRQPLASDTLLGILAPSTLSLGLVVLSFMHEVRIDLMAYLFGDLLAISPNDLAWILGGSAAVLILLAALWRPLLAITVHEELATVEGLPVPALRMTLMLLIAKDPAHVSVDFATHAAKVEAAFSSALDGILILDHQGRIETVNRGMWAMIGERYRDLVGKTPGAGLLRGMIGFAAGRLMEPQVAAVTGAACGGKDPARLAQRNG